MRKNFGIRNRRLLTEALTHRSYINENKLLKDLKDNEELEFLGDAVLGLVISDYLYRKYPQYSCGELSKLKGIIVSEPILTKQAISCTIIWLKAKLETAKPMVIIQNGRDFNASLTVNSLVSLISASVVAGYTSLAALAAEGESPSGRRPYCSGLCLKRLAAGMQITKTPIPAIT